MSPGKFTISYSALAQMALLSTVEKAALARLFSSDQINQPTTTHSIGDDRFVSRLGKKRVLWRRREQQEAEIISIVDKSYAEH